MNTAMKRILTISLFCSLTTIGFSKSINQYFLFQPDSPDVENCIFENSYVYGITCGMGGRFPYLREYLEDILKIKKYDNLNCWLDSKNPTAKAYALEGLYRSALAGNILTKSLLLKMDKLIKDTTVIYSCTGCLYGWPLHYADIVSQKDLNNIHDKRYMINEKLRKKELDKRNPHNW